MDERRGGDYVKIGAAIRKEKAGTRILVRPGHYRESLVIKKPLEIVGEGNRDNIIVEANGDSVVVFRASMGRVANLTLRNVGPGDRDAVDIAQGRLDLEDESKQSGVFVNDNGAGRIEDNVISANGYSGIEVTGGGDPTVRGN